MKRIYLLLSLCFALFSLAGCDTDLENIDTGFYSVQPTFNPYELTNNYRVTYNDSESSYISRSEKSFKLEVFRRDDATNTPVLTVDDCPSDKPVTLVHPVEQELAVYTGNEDKYTTFMPTIIFIGDKNDYTVTFNGGEIEVGIVNYIAKDNLTGTLKIVRKADSSTLYEEEITLEAGGKLQFMQLSDTAFMEIPKSDEPDPESKQYEKLRFFYTADAFPGHDKLRLVVYLMGTSQFSDPIVTIELEANKLSDYIQVDHYTFGEKRVDAVYDLIVPETGEKIVDNVVHIQTMIIIEDRFKFMTFRFSDPTHKGGDNVQSPKVENLCVLWE